jgi:hypothetical protein
MCAALAASIVYIVYKRSGGSDKLYFAPKAEKRLALAPKRKFYVYNYYKVPVSVKVSGRDIYGTNKYGKITVTDPMPLDASDYFITLVENVPSGKHKAITMDLWHHITDNKKINIINSDTGELIGESVMTIPQGKTIKALHCGMVSGHSDIALSSDITKSPLGTAIPRLRIVNVTPRVINLTTTGGNKLTIPPAKSLLYFGEYENGIPMGVTFKDIDGILPDYTLKIPLTDLFLGVISDIEIPLYRGSKIGGAFFDDPGEMYHPFEELNFYQLHRGAFIDKSYIPKNW